ncbi:MAG: DUF1501 domain-containing protein [Leadbetterella sp.]
MDRRKFIRNSTMGLGVASTLNLDKMTLGTFQPAQVNNENDNILVIVQLFGGNDGINTITTYEWPEYYKKYRPTLHIPQNTVHPISKELGLAMHPNLKLGPKDGMLGLFKSGKLAIMSGIGYDNPNYSHFRSTDIWLSGIVPPNDAEPLRSGWLGRYFDKYASSNRPVDPYCIQVGNNSSLMFLGETSEKSIVIESPDEFYNQAKTVENTKQSVQGSDIFKEEFNYVNDIGIQVNEYSAVIKKAFDKGRNLESYNNKSLSEQLKLVARLIDGGLKTKVFFVELNGFDTHSNQGILDGVHSKLLAELSEAISSFQSDIDKLGHSKRVLGITASEFGRRPFENGSAGTDHGTANIMFAFGDPVLPEIIGNHLFFIPWRDTNNLNYVTDFRSIYFEIMVTWFGQNIAFAEKVLGGKYAYINGKGFLKASVPDVKLPPPPPVPPPATAQNPYPSVQGPVNPAVFNRDVDAYKLFPNPVYENGTYLNMRFSQTRTVKISYTSLEGKFMGKLHQGTYKATAHNVFLDFKNTPPGRYVLIIEVGLIVNTIPFLRI